MLSASERFVSYETFSLDRLVLFFVAVFVAVNGPLSLQEYLPLRTDLGEKTFSPSSPKALLPLSPKRT
jgi:hypothetical protein